jgi:hypothetical protein
VHQRRGGGVERNVLQLVDQRFADLERTGDLLKPNV